MLRRCQRTSIEQQHVQPLQYHHQPSRDHRPIPGRHGAMLLIGFAGNRLR
jgi:hypothetical protein